MRVLTWNIRGSARPDLTRLASVLRERSIDLAMIQEARPKQARLLARLTGLDHSYWSFKHNPFGPARPGLAEGLALISRWPLAETRTIVLTEGVPKRRYKRRIAQSATVLVPGAAQPLHIVNVHLASHDDHEERRRQARRVAQDLLPERPASVIVAGDFNTDHDHEVFAPFTAKGIDAIDLDGSNRPTNPAGLPKRRLDRILASADLRALGDWTPDGSDLWGELSDHVPTSADFQLG